MGENKIIYTDMLAHKVITADIHGHPYIETGSGEKLSLDECKTFAAFIQSPGVYTEGTTVYVTDAACDKIKMVSPLNGTFSLLQNRRKLTYYKWG